MSVTLFWHFPVFNVTVRLFIRCSDVFHYLISLTILSVQCYIPHDCLSWNLFDSTMRFFLAELSVQCYFVTGVILFWYLCSILLRVEGYSVLNATQCSVLPCDEFYSDWTIINNQCSILLCDGCYYGLNITRWSILFCDEYNFVQSITQCSMLLCPEHYYECKDPLRLEYLCRLKLQFAQGLFHVEWNKL